VLVYPSSIDLSSRTLRFLTGQLTARRQEIGTRWRRLPVPFRGRRLKRWKRRHNTTHAKIRCLGERAMVTLKKTSIPAGRRCCSG
jgi:hypothetical protein